MSSIDQLVKVDIILATSPIAQPSFAIPLIVGPTTLGWSDNVHAYTSAAGMLTDGFTTSSPEYIWALALFNNAISPTIFYVGKRAGAPVAQVDTFAVNTLTTAHQYKFTLNGTVCSYTAGGGDTQQAILGQLLTQATATGLVTGAVVGTGSGALLTLTAVAAGQILTYSAIDASLTHLNPTPATGITTDLAAISTQFSGWYALMTPTATDADILQAAAYIEGNGKTYFAVSSTSAIVGSGSTDLGSKLKTAGYKRTALVYSAASVATGIEATWVGGKLPQTPGSTNWAYASLPGQIPDALTDAQVANAIGVPVDQIAGKNVNIYRTVGGDNIMQMGTMASGQFIDITIGLDWLQATIQTNIYALLVSGVKIPYTDIGSSILQGGVTAAIKQGVVNGLIDGATPYTVTAPKVLDVPSTQRANRVGPPIAFSCRLQGAINSVHVTGTVTV